MTTYSINKPQKHNTEQKKQIRQYDMRTFIKSWKYT